MPMPRRPRSLVDLGFYHVLTRGNDRKKIFKSPEDYCQFLRILKRYLKKYKIRIMHYCLMPNHIHLPIQTIKGADLPKFMQEVLQVYAHHYRKEYGSVGFVFQNRYKSFHIDKESYLLECARYIERNPVRAKLVSKILEYPWSSLNYYVKGNNDGIIIKENPFYVSMASNDSERRQRFYELVLEDRPYDQVVDDYFRI